MENVVEKVGEVYKEIAEEQEANRLLAGVCQACGKCCNFTEFDHKLFVTPAEIEYLAFHIGGENIKPVSNGTCPYNVNGKCTVYDYRFAGCRIFNCKGDKDFQSRLTESVLEKLKELCGEDYNYLELSAALKK